VAEGDAKMRALAVVDGSGAPVFEASMRFEMMTAAVAATIATPTSDMAKTAFFRFPPSV
jgi:hypothetical protein